MFLTVLSTLIYFIFEFIAVPISFELCQFLINKHPIKQNLSLEKKYEAIILLFDQLYIFIRIPFFLIAMLFSIYFERFIYSILFYILMSVIIKVISDDKKKVNEKKVIPNSKSSWIIPKKDFEMYFKTQEEFVENNKKIETQYEIENDNFLRKCKSEATPQVDNTLYAQLEPNANKIN